MFKVLTFPFEKNWEELQQIQSVIFRPSIPDKGIDADKIWSGWRSPISKCCIVPLAGHNTSFPSHLIISSWIDGIPSICMRGEEGRKYPQFAVVCPTISSTIYCCSAALCSLRMQASSSQSQMLHQVLYHLCFTKLGCKQCVSRTALIIDGKSISII